jgi:uncharacterized pyridoxal phosphate-containing UPF0001 family protein
MPVDSHFFIDLQHNKIKELFDNPKVLDTHERRCSAQLIFAKALPVSSFKLPISLGSSPNGRRDERRDNLTFFIDLVFWL